MNIIVSDKSPYVKGGGYTGDQWKGHAYTLKEGEKKGSTTSGWTKITSFRSQRFVSSVNIVTILKMSLFSNKTHEYLLEVLSPYKRTDKGYLSV